MIPILVGFFLRLIIIFRTECLHYMPVATLWPCSPYFLCSLLWICLEKNYGMEDLILIVRIYILSLVKYCSLQMLYFTWHNFFSAACLIPLGSEACLILTGIHLCCICLLQAELAVLLLFLCRPMGAGPATYIICAYGSGCEFAMPQLRLASITNILWWALLQPLISYASMVPRPSRQQLLV
jgi:hypothetical protein